MVPLVSFLAGLLAGAAAAVLAVRSIHRRRPASESPSLSRLAHDLRTPLASITAYAEILKDDTTIEPSDRERFSGIIHEEAGRMEKMIEGLTTRGAGSGTKAPATGSGRTGPARGRTILVVDDDRYLVEATRTLLSREGFVALGALGGEEALTQARAGRPDLILMDMGMPGMTGEQTLSRLRDDAATRRIPVIITTGDDDVRAVEGAAAVLTKPVTRERLMAAIEAARPAHALGGSHS